MYSASIFILCCYFLTMSIAMNIKTLRKNKGWTQVELAQKLHTSQQVITSYETGKKKPPLERLPQIAGIFGVTIDEIVGTKPVTAKEHNRHVHKNSRTAKIQDLFDKLNMEEQRMTLKQVRALVESKTR